MREIFERNSEKLTVEEDGRVWEMVEEKARMELGMVKPNEIFVNVSR